MFHRQGVKAILTQFLALLSLWPNYHDCLIITSVLAGDKKFKTISFDTKLLKPLTFEKELPTTEFRRHRTLRPPKFDIDVNIPIKLPLEDEYPQEEYKKPVTSHIAFESGEIVEPNYGNKYKNYPTKQQGYNANELAYAASNKQSSSQQQQQPADVIGSRRASGTNIQSNNNVPVVDQLAYQMAASNQIDPKSFKNAVSRSDIKEPQQQAQKQPQQEMLTQESYPSNGYAQQAQNYGNDYQQDFVPGGFVNLQLSGPSGGPKMTYEDFDREKWAQQLSQTAGAMPYPILNYQQLQNFYGGLGTFTNGLAENRYMSHSILDKLKSGLHHFASKLHFGKK